MKKICFVILFSVLTLSANAQVFSIQQQPGTTVATSISQCPVSSNPGYSLCPVAPVSGTPFLTLSVNGSTPVQIGGLVVNGTVQPNHMATFASSTAVQDGGAVPIVPPNVVLSSTTSAVSGHVATWTSTPNTIGDGGTLPNFANFKLTCPNYDINNSTGFNCPNTSAQ